MADRRFRGAHGNSRRVSAKTILERARLDAVIQRRGSSVQIDVTDVGRAKARVLNRELHCTRRFNPRVVEANAMVGVACRTVAHDLRVNTSAPRTSGALCLD